MPRLNIQQDTSEWHELRDSKIGASDVSAILGLSPYKTAYELWLEKTGKKPRPNINDAMRYGKKMEPILREQHFQDTDELYSPAVFTHDKISFIMASLDGISFDETKILEIKACNKEVYEEAKKGNVIPHYYAQIQAQLACVPSAKLVEFLCFHQGETTVVKCERDEEYIEKLLLACVDFQNSVVNDVSPEMSERDVLFIEDDPDFEKAATKWRQLKHQYDHIKKQLDQARKELLELTDDGSVFGYGVQIKKSYPTRYDYKKACEECNIDLSAYKKESIVWTLSEKDPSS